MLKSRRSSTPSQKEKEKEKSKAEKGNKKQGRSASTSAIKNNNNNSINNNTNASASFSYSLPNNDKRDISSDGNNVNSYTNNNPDNSESPATMGEGQHWSDFVCETVLLVLNDGGGLHFEVLGGADEGRFPYVGPQHTSAEECGVTVQSLSPSGKPSISLECNREPEHVGY